MEVAGSPQVTPLTGMLSVHFLSSPGPLAPLALYLFPLWLTDALRVGIRNKDTNSGGRKRGLAEGQGSCLCHALDRSQPHWSTKQGQQPSREEQVWGLDKAPSPSPHLAASTQWAKPQFKIKHGPYSGLRGRQAGVCAGGSRADKRGRGTRRGTCHPSSPLHSLPPYPVKTKAHHPSLLLFLDLPQSLP